jgi:hypothetical protein
VRRPLPNLLTLISLLLLAAVSTLWLHSYARTDTFSIHVGVHNVGVCSDRGRLAAGYAHVPALADAPDSQVRWDWRAPLPDGPPDSPWAALGLGRGTVPLGRAMPVLGKLPFLASIFTNAVPAEYAQAPWWPLAVAAGPCLRLRTAVRRRGRSRNGWCAQCGYDLCATPGRCPECGDRAGKSGVNRADREVAGPGRT